MDPYTATSLFMLAFVAWREARGEPLLVRAAVIMSILNRVDRPKWWGRSVLTVATRRLQYSSLTYPKDPQLATWPEDDHETAWVECLTLAQQALEGHLRHPFPGADSYHDVSIAPPKWATPDTFVGKCGRLLFYNLDRDVEAAVLKKAAA